MDKLYDIIIIGAGPAGLTAAIYASRANKSVLVLEANSYGGQIITTVGIDNYPANPGISGYDFSTKLYNQALDLGMTYKNEKVIDIEDGKKEKSVITSKNTYKGKTIIIATGNDSRKLNLENEKELIGRGVSYCATCDGGFFKGREVAVNGGGNTALEEARYLSDICKKVYLIHRRDTFRGEERKVKQLSKKENVEFILNSNVTKLNGTNKLESIEITDKDGNTSELKVSALFVAIGRIPENGNITKDIDTEESGYIIAGEDCKTNIDGIFAAGDNRVKSLRQLVTATSDGAIAATNAINYINERIDK